MYDLIIASFLDLLIGDPYNLFHPVKVMGHCISIEEKAIRKFFHRDLHLQWAGLIMTMVNICVGFLVPFFLLKVSHGLIRHILAIYIIYSSISGKMLAYEAKQVKKAFAKGLSEARNRLKYIVGRDTQNLSEEEIICATIETVAENTSDGVIAPLFYILLLGPAGGWMYKFVNTMDSMVGYRNDKYENLGKASALVDDLFNFIPARLTSFYMIASNIWRDSFFYAWRIVKRDHRNHLSPNAGYPESAVAGLLRVQLGGGHYYFGKYVDKPTIGDKMRPVEWQDIDRVIHILYSTMFLAIVTMTMAYKFIHM